MKIYTRTGDAGTTGLFGGGRVPKDALEVEAYGSVDELNACIGIACVTCEEAPTHALRLGELAAILRRIQHELFNLGSILSTLPKDVHPNQARITLADVEALEREIDEMNGELKPLVSFVLPGGGEVSALLHVARTVCRRAERLLVPASRGGHVEAVILAYINRLSDWLFVQARRANHIAGVPDVPWLAR